MSNKLRDYLPMLFGSVLVIIGLAIMIGIDYLAYQSIHASIDSGIVSAILAMLVGGVFGRIYFSIAIAVLETI